MYSVTSHHCRPLHILRPQETERSLSLFSLLSPGCCLVLFLCLFWVCFPGHGYSFLLYLSLSSSLSRSSKIDLAHYHTWLLVLINPGTSFLSLSDRLFIHTVTSPVQSLCSSVAPWKSVFEDSAGTPAFWSPAVLVCLSTPPSVLNYISSLSTPCLSQKSESWVLKSS